MKVHVFQHVAFEDLGSIRSWLDERGAEIRYTRFFTNDPLPRLDDVDLLIVLGGPMSVNDETELPWLVPEKQAIRDVVAKNVPILGICLGAQLIASALGGRVYPGAAKEIGWFPIQAVDSPAPSFRFPSQCTVFHWHGETFDLPVGAVRLAKSAGCRNQAFELQRNVVGLQFHLETTRDGALGMLEHCSHELVPGPYVQTADEIRAIPISQYEVVNTQMRDVLIHLTQTT